MTELEDLIGIPFQYNGRSTKALDCYGLIKLIYQTKGIELPDYTAPEDGNAPTIAAMMAAGKTLWQKVDKKPNTVIYMRLGIYHWHVGFYLGDDLFIHTSESTGGVCIERLSAWFNRIEGFYEYAGSAEN